MKIVELMEKCDLDEKHAELICRFYGGQFFYVPRPAAFRRERKKYLIDEKIQAGASAAEIARATGYSARRIRDFIREAKNGKI